MLAAVTIDGADRGIRVDRFTDDGRPVGGETPVRVARPGADDVGDAAALVDLERREHPRWIFDGTSDVYREFVDRGLRVRHSHDIALTERILLGRDGRFGQPCRAAAVLARRAGVPPPDDPPPWDERRDEAPQPRLFGTEPEAQTYATLPTDVVAAYLDQRERIAASAARDGIALPPGALRLLTAAESGSALVAAEMTRRGMPWDRPTHERILAEILGPRPAPGQRPARLADLAARITEAFGFPVNPDSPAEVKEALRRSGFAVESTRAWVLREVDHPAVAPLLDYKDRVRLYTANGWNWLDEWISPEGRLAAQFLPGAVVSGRWATRGGGGLQIPASIRSAAVARPGHLLVVADAAQLEPRILAAVSKDRALTDLATGPDLYAALAADGFGGDRRHAKLAMLGAMYGQTSGEAARLMATMRVRYPDAVGYVEAAAERGETGGIVQSILGRACPPPSEAWRRILGGAAAVVGDSVPTSGDVPGRPARLTDPASAARRAARDRGRFTRNFVIQASAADWAAVWMTTLRLALMDEAPAAEIVLFQHDELVVHVPESAAPQVVELVVTAAARARDLVFPGSAVALPVRPQIVTRYSDAK